MDFNIKIHIDNMDIYGKIYSMLTRIVKTQLDTYIKGEDYKIFFMWGPRRSGKTTLLEEISKEYNIPIFNFDLLTDRELFVPREEALDRLVAETNIILIDEIQNYPESTLALKILYDQYKVKVIATGSSELRQKSAKNFDTLANRFTEHYCLPLSVDEIVQNNSVPLYDMPNFEYSLQDRIQMYGSYPEVYTQTHETEKINLLQNLLNTYVLKDVVNIYNLKDEKLAKDILTKIALQIGSEVSVREIANSLGANETTVANYIEIFIKNYILIPLPAFKTNARRAVSENRKLFFYDIGIRNMLVKDFRDLELRPDKGGLFENFIVSELEKRRRNFNVQENMYFYREYSGAEVDIVLENYKKSYHCIEVKVGEHRQSKDIFPLPHTFTIVNTKNYFEKLTAAFPDRTNL